MSRTITNEIQDPQASTPKDTNSTPDNSLKTIYRRFCADSGRRESAVRRADPGREEAKTRRGDLGREIRPRTEYDFNYG